MGVMRHLSSMGFGLSIDDFGTGYSSLSYLRRFPIDKIKIDKSFVAEMTDDNDAAAIVGTIIGLGRSLNLGVVAEGIETKPQLKQLKRLGCDEGQGYLFSRPLPVQDFETLLATRPNGDIGDT
jgi:EAL domain-containing protein (putative c-di-GMP-specific phosphodiesterase class I)